MDFLFCFLKVVFLFKNKKLSVRIVSKLATVNLQTSDRNF